MMRNEEKVAQAAHQKLYCAAGRKISIPRLKIFATWHQGLTPAAMLLLLAKRYLEVASIAQAVIANPVLAKKGGLASRVSAPSDGVIKRLAKVVGLELMGGWCLSLTNTDCGMDLAKAYDLMSKTGRIDSTTDVLTAFNPRDAVNAGVWSSVQSRRNRTVIPLVASSAT